jgi:hypothetical protein
LSEDLLKYTPKGGNAELPMTMAVNVAHDKVEREIERDLKTYNVSSTYYDLVTLQAQLQLKNFEKETVQIVVTCPVPGKPIEADHDGVLSIDATKLKFTERAGAVRWVVELEPGQQQTLTCRYERYVRSH